MKRKYIKYLIFLVIIILLIRFINSPWKWGDKDLGDKYVLMEDGRFTSIVYCNKVPYNGTGLEVLPDYINDYDFNKNFIIAKRIDLKSDKEDYWIIDKRHKINIDSCYDQKSCDSVLRSNVIGPLDFDTYKKQKELLNIDLKLKKIE